MHIWTVYEVYIKCIGGEFFVKWWFLSFQHTFNLDFNGLGKKQDKNLNFNIFNVDLIYSSIDSTLNYTFHQSL